MQSNIKMEDCFPYSKARPAQEDILKSLDKIYSYDDKYRYIVIEAGTGIGKSAIAKSISKKEKTCYLLTATKQLQDQYIHDFGNMGASAVKGSVNYECAVDDTLDCSNGACKLSLDGMRSRCYADKACPYQNAKQKADASEMFVTSYAYFLRVSRGNNTSFKSRNVIIVDECHMLEDQLINCAGFTLNPEKMNHRYQIHHGMDFKTMVLYKHMPNPDDEQQMIQWIFLVKKLIAKRMEIFQKSIFAARYGDRSQMTADELSDVEDLDIKDTSQKLEELKRLYEKIIKFLNEEDKSNWVMSVKDKQISVKPINVDGLFKQLIDKFAVHKVVFMSATILDKVGFCNDMGIEADKTCFVTRDGVFSAKRSPIVYDPVGSMSYKNINFTMPYVIDEIKRIMELYPNEKGIIHTATYNIAQQITEAIKSDRFVVREHDESNEDLFQYHAQSDKPTILVSPSLMAGVDLHDDLSRFQIVVKLPYISLADERVKRKMQKNQKWYTCKMLRNLVQECGRSTRNEKDWSVTYILDNAFEKTVYFNKKMLSPHFLNRIVNVNNFKVQEYRNLVK